MSPSTLTITIASLAGLVVGSFVNVLVARVPAEKSIVSPRSRCPRCGAPLRWYENIPLLSFALLRGRCRSCHAAISWRYPAVEAATALWFALCFALPAHLLNSAALPSGLLFDSFLHSVEVAILGCLLIALACIDWEHQQLPDSLTLTGVAAGLFFACIEAIFLNDGQDDVVLQHPIHINSANAGRSTGNVFLTGPEHLIFSRLFAAAAAFLLLYLIRIVYRAVRKRDGMGAGDAKLLAMIAAFLGFAPTAVALASGIFLATLYAVYLLVRRGASASTRLPFGSFLALGGLVAGLYGQRIADAYLALFP